MGYRNYISILSKYRHQQIKDLTHGELVRWYKNNIKDDDFDGSDYVPAHRLSKELYCLGKYCDLQYLKPFKTPIFTKVRTNNKMNDDGEFYFIGKDGLAAVIEDYRKKVASYYEKILDPSKFEEFEEIVTPQMHIERHVKEWNGDFAPYNISLKSASVVTSWKYEYAIFEMVRIFKTVDFETYEVCITGW